MSEDQKNNSQSPEEVKPKKNNGGRPPIEINWETVNNLCAIFCTLTEIAKVIGVSEDTIERHCKRKFKMSFADYFKQESSKGRMSLRRKQFESALGGNVTLLIWLGKQHLGQSDYASDNATKSTMTFEISDKYFSKPSPEDEPK